MSYRFLLSFSLMILLGAACTTKPGTDGEKPTSPLAELEARIIASPTNAALFAERAVLFESMDSARLALNDWNRAIALDSTKVAYRISLADLYYRKVRISEAENVLTKAVAMSGDATEARLKLAELKLVKREYKEAMELANDALRLDPLNAQGYFLKGWIHMEGGDTTMALSSFRTAVEQDPAFLDAYIQLGQLHAAIGDPLSAQYYRSALEIQPRSIEAWYGLGMLAQEMNNDSMAIDCYARIKEIMPSNPLAWYNTGYVLLVLRDQPGEALAEFDQALQLSPSWPEAYYNRGLCYERGGQLDSALLDYRRSLTIRPDMTLAAEGLTRLAERGVSVRR